MSAQQLPYEILESIFYVVSEIACKNDLFQCGSVSQSWHLPACRVIYETLDTESINQLLDCFERQSQNKGAFCRVLEINPMPNVLNSQKYKHLLSYLPNLQSITINDSDPTYHLEQIRENASLINYVKSICLDTDNFRPEELQAYYDCAYTFKDSLQCLKFASLDTNISSCNGRRGNMITFLPEFSCLTNLDIINESLPQLCMFAVMRSCPNLINFTFYNGFQEPENDYDNYRFDHSKLRFLEIKLPEVTQSHINYLVTNITQLNHIKIYCGVSDHIIDDWMDRVGVDNLNKLREYFNNIEKVNFNLGYEQFKLDLNNFWPLVNNLIKKKSLTPTIVYMRVFDERIRFEHKMSLQKSKTNLLIHGNMGPTEVLPLRSVVNSLESVKSIIAPPGLNKDDVQLYDIRFNLDKENKEEKLVCDLYVNVLDVIINNFTTLSKFDIKFGGYDDYFHYQIKMCSNRIGYDKEFGYNFEDDNSLKDSILYLPSHSASDYERLAYVTLWRIDSAAHIALIMNRLPATRYLKFLKCDFALDYQYNLTLDLNRLSLLQLKLEITSVLIYERFDLKSIVLQIEEGESNQTKYFEWNEDFEKRRQVIFEAVDMTDSSKQKQFSSSSYTFIIIKCQRVEQIIISVSMFSSTFLVSLPS